MIENKFAEFVPNAVCDTFSCAESTDFAWKSRISPSAGTRILRTKQTSSDQCQIGHGRRHVEAMQILRRAAYPRLNCGS